jgi:hypothetical protein
MRRLIPLVLCFALACGSDSPTTPKQTTASLTGTWSLNNINGIALPFVLAQTSTTKSEVVSDIVTATAAGTYTEVTQLRTTVNGTATNSTENDSGTYTINGNTVVIRSIDGSSISGTINSSGNAFTVAASGIAFEYRKQ